MDKNKFKGNIKEIGPNRLIDRHKNHKTESFFLGLAAIFNDIKGILMFEKILTDNYEKPEDDKPTDHAGNFAGMMVQSQKLLASILNEFFKFLEKNNSISDESEFNGVFDRLSKSNQRLWQAMFDTANNKNTEAANLLNAVHKIRHNISFHYDHSGKVLRRGYVSRFFGETLNNKTKYAYYSIGDTINETRFYFADAAVEESLYLAIGKKEKESYIDDESIEKYKNEVKEVVTSMSVAIIALLKNYIQDRRNQPKK